MCEPSPLVPNLNEMMEEYAEMEEETVQVTQAETKQEGERAEEARAKTEQPVEETRKGMRRAKEARVERREEKVSDLVSKCAYLT